MNHNIIMQREPSGKDYTYGTLMFKDYKCLTIEDEFRQIKIPDETRIPPDTYEIKLRREGGMYKRAARDPRFSHFHDGMLHLQNVPDFKWIYLHWGVIDDHTAGCVILGKTKINWKGQPGLGYSSAAYEDLYKLLHPHLNDSNDKVFITIKDNEEENYYEAY